MLKSPHDRILVAITLATALAGPTSAARAADLWTTSTSFTPPTFEQSLSALLDQVNRPTAPGPLSPLGVALQDIGITPKLFLVGIYMFNPSMGQRTGQSERVNILSMGFDADLEKMAGLKGSSFHFQYFWVPPPYNNGDVFGAYVGDSLIGQAGPYIPEIWHLTQLTWEQKLFDGRMDAAFGIDNAGNYFGVPICNQPFLCQSGTMQNSVGMNPPPYSNYSARVAYHFSPEWTAQIGYWRSNPAFPFTDGWQGWGGTVTTPDGFTIENPNSNLFLFNVVHELDAKTNLYPHRYELMFYYNDAAQTDPATGVVHSGTSGMYIGGRQSIWRANNEPFATSVSAYASLYSTFDPQNEYGFGTQVNAGVMLHSPFASRPLDSYSINFIWNHLTDSKQTALINANTGYYTVGPDEFSLGIDANLLVAGNFILQPWLRYVWNVNTFQNPVFSGNPKDGWAFGFNYVVLLDRMLGLAPPPK